MELIVWRVTPTWAASSAWDHSRRNKVVQTVLHPVVDKLGISRKGRRVGLHAFRHTVASMLLQTAGAAVAQRQLRHADPATTLGIYGHVLGGDQREAMGRLNRYSQPSSSD
jgi:integrase